MCMDILSIVGESMLNGCENNFLNFILIGHLLFSSFDGLSIEK